MIQKYDYGDYPEKCYSKHRMLIKRLLQNATVFYRLNFFDNRNVPTLSYLTRGPLLFLEGERVS